MDGLVQKLGKVVKKVARNRGSNWWYTPLMAAASRAITKRIPLVDFILEVRDARIPLSSECCHLRNISPSFRRIIVLNKTDLANHSQTKDWINFFEESKSVAFGVNSHNKENIKEYFHVDLIEAIISAKDGFILIRAFLKFVQARVRELKKTDASSHTITLMLVGIPNVGKSALANALHQVGRIGAAEKGKLKHAVISPRPGETQSISSFKIASHPNIYVLDTPGVLPPELTDDRVSSNLALTGAISDHVVGEVELARYFLCMLNLSDEYKKWGKFSVTGNGQLSNNQGGTTLASSELGKRRERRYPTDHTQDFTVNSVRQSIFQELSSFAGNVENEEDLTRLMEVEFKVLQRVFHLPAEPDEENRNRVASKLLNLYRIGRLGHYTLDPVY